MPIAVSVDELRPGMRLARPVRNQWSTLLTAGTTFTPERIRRLHSAPFDEPILIEDPLLDSKVEFDDPTRDQELAIQMHREMVGTLANVEAQFAKSMTLGKGDFLELQRSMADVIEHLQDNPTQSAFLIKARSADEYLRCHAANVFYLAMLVGKELRDYIFNERRRQSAADRIYRPLDLTPLGHAALLHDIGMIPLGSIYRKRGRLSTDELEQVRNHPITGAKMIPEGCSPFVRTVVLQHHENAEGSGYPEGRRGNDTHVFSRIVRVADSFDAATSARLYSEARPACRVLYEITIGPCRHLYDPALTKVFSGLIQPFPIGARLRLTTGQFGIVVRHNPSRPFAPVIIVAFDEQGNRIPTEELKPPLDLAHESRIRLHSFGRERLGYVYTGAATLASRRTPTEARSVFELVYP